MKRPLTLGVFEGMTTQKEIQEKIISEFEADPAEVKKYRYLVAYVDYGSYQGTGWILMQHKETNDFYENHSSHCSCYGNEDQFEPEETTIEYLKSDRFSCYCYEGEDRLIREYIKKLKPTKTN
jgi:hypothetical protein